MLLEGSNLLMNLQSVDRQLLAESLSECILRTGQVLYEPGDVIQRCYFPCGSSVASFMVMLEDGNAVETAMIGREGAVGGIVSSGHLPAFARTGVLHGGPFLSISTSDLERAKDRSPSISRLFARYADCLLAQVFQSVACNANHMIEQRAAKWLCAAVARTGSNEITMKQEQLASIMGVGRSYVSRVVGRFKALDLITVRRGVIKVIDADRLERLACQCNGLVERHFDTVLAGTYPTAADRFRRAV